jgi:hypothetical protein
MWVTLAKISKWTWDSPRLVFGGYYVAFPRVKGVEALSLPLTSTWCWLLRMNGTVLHFNDIVVCSQTMLPLAILEERWNNYNRIGGWENKRKAKSRIVFQRSLLSLQYDEMLPWLVCIRPSSLLHVFGWSPVLSFSEVVHVLGLCFPLAHLFSIFLAVTSPSYFLLPAPPSPPTILFDYPVLHQSCLTTLLSCKWS